MAGEEVSEEGAGESPDAVPSTDVRTFCAIPDDAMATEVIEVCRYRKPDGTTKVMVRVGEGVPLELLLGLLRLAEHQLVEDAKTW